MESPQPLQLVPAAWGREEARILLVTATEVLNLERSLEGPLHVKLQAAEKVSFLCDLLDAEELAVRGDEDDTQLRSLWCGFPPEPHVEAWEADGKHSASSGASLRGVDISLLSRRELARAQRGMLSGNPRILQGLAKLLRFPCEGGAAVKLIACNAIAGIAHDVENATRVAAAQEVLAGLLDLLTCKVEDGHTSMECTAMRSAACRTMVHLTMNNEVNKISLVRFPGMLEGLKSRIEDLEDEEAQDNAAVVLAFLADNYAAGRGHEAAESIVRTEGMVRALRRALVHIVEHHEARFSVLAAVISLCDHQSTRDVLRGAGLLEILEAMFHCKEEGLAYDTMRSEALLVVASMTQDPHALEVGCDVLFGVVQLVKRSVAGCRNEGSETVWAVLECLRPLARLAFNTSNRRALAKNSELMHALVHVLRRWGGVKEKVAREAQCEEAGLAVLLIGRLLDECMLSEGRHPRQLCGSPYSAPALSWPGRLDQAKMLLRRQRAREVLYLIAEQLNPVEDDGGVCFEPDLFFFSERHLALCLSAHPRLGADSWLNCLDPFVFRVILEKACQSLSVAAYCLGEHLEQPCTYSGRSVQD